MIKICITILAVYLLYYAVNIVYDLYLKKEASTLHDEDEEYSLTLFEEQNANKVKVVSIDDVEPLNTSNSFKSKELFPLAEEELYESLNLDYYRTKFEFEQDIDDFEYDFKIKEEKKDNVTEGNAQSEPEKEDAALKLKQQFNQFLNLAETHVQVLLDRDGFKVYHSVI